MLKDETYHALFDAHSSSDMRNVDRTQFIWAARDIERLVNDERDAKDAELRAENERLKGGTVKEC